MNSYFIDAHIGVGCDDVNFSGNLFRVIDIEESTDKETIHLLIHLLMQFMSRQDLAFPTEEKPTCRLMQVSNTSIITNDSSNPAPFYRSS